MKNRRSRYFFLSLLSAVVLDAGTPAFAFNLHTAFEKRHDIFLNERPVGFNEVPVGTEELDDMRGGFITSNGMVIDFSFSANTLIDGQLINQIVLDTADLVANVSQLRRIIQVGEGNQAFDDATNIDALPNILTVVQNNLDNLTIQQLNMLDLTVQNVDKFVNQSVMPEIDFQNSMSLAP